MRAVPTLAVQMGGRFVGGTDAVRRVALALLETSWDGSLTVQCAEVEAIETELQKLESLTAYKLLFGRFLPKILPKPLIYKEKFFQKR